MQNNIYKYCLIFLALFIFNAKVVAQFDMMLYGYRFVPQSNYNNPAFIPKGKIAVGIPVLSSISTSTYSSSFSLDDILKGNSSNDSLKLDLSYLILKGQKTNLLTEYVDNDILYVGFKLENNFLSFGIRNRLYSRFVYSEDLVKLLWNGNASYLDEELNLSSTKLNHDHFLDYYINFALALNENVCLGIRANLLQGLSSVQTQRNELTILTNSQGENGYSFDANTSFLINTSGFNSDSTNPGGVSDYIFNFKNLGFSFDIGADFKISERFNINFSILDLGKINWKSNLTSYESKADNVHFSGITVDINSNDDVFESYLDSITNLVDINEYEKEYSTSLPTRFYAGLEYYSFDRRNRLSFVFSGILLKNKFSPAFSVGYDRDVSKHFAFKVNYSYLAYAPLNVGAGFSFNFKPFQFYFLTDNLFSTFLWDKQRYLNVRFGINILIPEQNSIPKGEPVFTK